MPPGFTIIDNDSIIGRLPEIDGTALKVYLALARRADSSGRCWPSVATIAADTGLCVRAVRSALRDLVELRLLALDIRPGTSTIYRLLTPDIGCTPEKQVGTSDESTPLTSDERGGGTSDERGTRNKNKKQEQDGRAPAKRFVVPTISEVTAYCRERKNQVDPQRFLDYYESNGWRVGKNAMKDWRAAVRTWERNGFSQAAPEKKSEPLKYRG